MSSDHARHGQSPHDPSPFDHGAGRAAREAGGADPQGRAPSGSSHEVDDDVIRIEDLAPRENVTGGRKIVLGEAFPPLDEET